MTNFWLEAWDERGLAFERRANVPEMQTYLGGVESEESMRARHRRFLDAPSNAVGRKAGFELRDEVDFEYPLGHPIRCNDWRYDLQKA